MLAKALGKFSLRKSFGNLVEMTEKIGIALITRAVFSYENFDLLCLGSFWGGASRVDQGSGIEDGSGDV